MSATSNVQDEKYTYDSSDNFIENKAIYMWIFDEVLGKNNDYEGNTLIQAKLNLVQILKFINKKTTDKIIEINKFILILENNTIDLESFMLNNNYIKYMHDHNKILIVCGCQVI
jgi:hypothetical protein